MKRLLFIVEQDELQPEPEIDVADIFRGLSKSHPLSLLSVSTQSARAAGGLDGRRNVQPAPEADEQTADERK